MLEKFFQEVKNKPYVPPKELVFDPLKNVTTNPQILLDALANVSKIDTQRLYDLIMTGYPFLLDKEFIDTNAVVVARAFIDEKFIGIFSQILMTKVDEFTYDQKINCNRLIYEYIIYKNNNKQAFPYGKA